MKGKMSREFVLNQIRRLEHAIYFERQNNLQDGARAKLIRCREYLKVLKQEEREHKEWLELELLKVQR